MNYEKDTQIDNSALDVEWLKQPTLMFQYTQHQAKMEQKYTDTIEEFELYMAKIDKDVRTNPEEYEITGKVTETVVKNTIITSEKYEENKHKVVLAKYELDVAKGAVRAIDTKKTSLENLVKLHGQSYFAGPSVPRDLDKEWEKQEKQKSSNKKVKIERRK